MPKKYAQPIFTKQQAERAGRITFYVVMLAAFAYLIFLLLYR